MIDILGKIFFTVLVCFITIMHIMHGKNWQQLLYYHSMIELNYFLLFGMK